VVIHGRLRACHHKRNNRRCVHEPPKRSGSHGLTIAGLCEALGVKPDDSQFITPTENPVIETDFQFMKFGLMSALSGPIYQFMNRNRFQGLIKPTIYHWLFESISDGRTRLAVPFFLTLGSRIAGSRHQGPFPRGRR